MSLIRQLLGELVGISVETLFGEFAGVLVYAFVGIFDGGTITW